MVLPTLNGVDPQQREVFADLHEQGYDVEDLMEVEGEEEEVQEAPTPPPKPTKKRKMKIKDPLGVTRTPKVLAPKIPLLKKKKKPNNTLVLLEQLLAKLGTLGTPHVEARPPPTNNNVRVPTPAAFTGKRGSFQYFASKVESYAVICNIAKEKWVAVALQCMEEKPTKVWGTYVKRKEREGEDGRTITWEAFKEFMSKRYDSTDLVAQARQKLDHVYQGTESVEKYIERFVTLVGDIETDYEMSEHDKIHLFLKGLNTPIRLACAINPQTGVRFTDLDDLCSYVVQYESNLKAGGMLRGQEGRKVLGAIQTPAQHGRQGKPPSAPRSSLGTVSGAVTKVDSRPSVPADRQCFFCKEYGHEQWQCQAKRDYLARKSRQALPPPPPNFGHWKEKEKKRVHWRDKK